MKNIIKEYEKSQMKKNIPKINTGYYVEIKIWITEGKKKRIQKFKGTIISIKNKGLNSSFTVRKITNNEGIERVFQMHSHIINKIKIINNNRSKRSKLYYLRNIKRFSLEA
uniref:Large ribosomal subunit protein bL19m n=2 Tax=Cacopsylla melanoneura TaxID=428564 RepID=A0A8D8QS63_9HEMI